MNIIKVWVRDYEWKIEGELNKIGGYIKGVSGELSYYTISTMMSLEELAKTINKIGYVVCDGNQVIFSKYIFKLSL